MYINKKVKYINFPPPYIWFDTYLMNLTFHGINITRHFVFVNLLIRHLVIVRLSMRTLRFCRRFYLCTWNQ